MSGTSIISGGEGNSSQPEISRGAAILPKPDPDPVYYTEFSEVFDAEKHRIAEAPGNRPLEKGDDLCGLAISGGGIRSASFALGVMQALKRGGVLKKMDYLSTVSGGGYIGSSLTWWLSPQPHIECKFAEGEPTKDDEPTEDELEAKIVYPDNAKRRRIVGTVHINDGAINVEGVSSLRPDTSPKKLKKAKEAFEKEARRVVGEAKFRRPLSILFKIGPIYSIENDDLFPFGQKYKGARETRDENPNAILNFIRQHGNYLIPGQGINTASLGAITLRAMFVSLLVYFAWLTLAMLGIIFLVNLGSILPHDCIHWATDQVRTFGPESKGVENPAFVVFFFFLVGFLAIIFIVGSLFYSLATVFAFLSGDTRRYRHRTWVQIGFGWILTLTFCALVIGMLPIIDANLENWVQKAIAAAFPAGLGGALGFLQYRKEQSADKPDSALSSMLPVIGALLLLYGLTLGAYLIAGWVYSTDLTVIIGIGVFLGASFFGWMVNVNHLGIHRMYRDRLMETFLPNMENVKTNQWGRATYANEALIEEMCQKPNQRPYHLINTNIVLVDSPTSKFRGRGGDSFVLSPLYCGSDATGWRKSSDYMKYTGKKGGMARLKPMKERGKSGRGMTLSTAMAISGAAANPNTGAGGRGLTRNRMVSMLMWLLNLRLGYWAPHPNPQKYAHFWEPNFIKPGLRGLGGILDENRKYIELTDGAHFENLALYELIRRRLKLIIVCDGGADKDFLFGDLANAVERVKVDFGVKIRFEYEDEPTDEPPDLALLGEENPQEDYSLQWLLPGSAHDGPLTEKYNLARRGFAVGQVTYPTEDPEKMETGTLLYLKTTLIPGLPPDIYGYKSANPTFPDQTTADQFFDEAQFEAYRELGYQLGKQLLEVNRKEKWIPVL